MTILVKVNFISRATKSFEASKALFGAQNCFLLKINSRASYPVETEHLPDPWSQFLYAQVDTKESNENSGNNCTQQTSLEIGQEAKEFKATTNYHPLAPLTDNSIAVSFRKKY